MAAPLENRAIKVVVTKSRLSSIKLSGILPNLVLIAAGLLLIFPIYWVINLSFQTINQIFSTTPVWFPVTPILTWYQRVFSQAHFGRPLLNSLIVSISSMICVLVISSMTAYALSRLRFPLRKPLFILFIGTMMVPEQVLMIPRYLMLLKFHWENTYQGLFVPYLGGAFGVFLLTQFFGSIPKDLDESAKIDGANHFQILAYIIIPLSKGPLVALGILEFLGNWNTFLWALIAINNDSMRTVAIEAFFLQGKTTGSAEIGMVFVGAVLTTLPVLLLYLVFQKHIVGSLGHLAMKG
jgi:ABC-type glycerol-3-phosphate transport system permease component